MITGEVVYFNKETRVWNHEMFYEGAWYIWSSYDRPTDVDKMHNRVRMIEGMSERNRAENKKG